MKNIRIVHLKFFIFLVVKFSVYLNRRVFVMWNSIGIKGEEVLHKYVLSATVTVVFLLTFPMLFLCCSCSFFMHRWFHM